MPGFVQEPKRRGFHPNSNSRAARPEEARICPVCELPVHKRSIKRHMMTQVTNVNTNQVSQEPETNQQKLWPFPEYRLFECFTLVAHFILDCRVLMLVFTAQPWKAWSGSAPEVSNLRKLRSDPIRKHELIQPQRQPRGGIWQPFLGHAAGSDLTFFGLLDNFAKKF